MKKQFFILFLSIFTSLWAFAGEGEAKADEEKTYEPNWESFHQYEIPEWFRDAKLGIYFHWGPYSVPAYDFEWYSRLMYIDGHDINEYHKKTYGPPEEFGYKDFIPMFKGEHFDADEWVDLFVKAGAKFIGPVTEHADGFAMWDSDLTKWDARDMGPKIDVVGEMEKAVRDRGLKFITTFHHHWLHAWYPTWDENMDCSKPEYRDLYGPVVPSDTWGPHDEMPDPAPDEEFCNRWYTRVVEVINKYRPDLIYFDAKMHIIDEDYRLKLLSYYYNKGEAWDRDVVFTYKFEDMKPHSAVLDLERSRLGELSERPWLTDDSMDWDSWSHVQNPNYKSTDRLVDFLVDVVSKNGNVLLNVPPMANGKIPEPVKKRLLEMGEWLKINGEAIYGTRPWKIYGEGPTEISEGRLNEKDHADHVAADIRYTTKGETLYAFTLAIPQKPLMIKTLSDKRNQQIKEISLLGSQEKVNWEQSKEGLQIQPPSEAPCDHALTYKIAFK